MSRPRLCRNITQDPNVTFYKPVGIPIQSIEVVKITHEEWEALRLKHEKKLNQIEAAKQMHTSQSTFQRIITTAQEKIGSAIIQGKGIEIIKE